jgi:diguanylate cyclase (GGDEF)-like protein/PAS domain S-box-containing protein
MPAGDRKVSSVDSSGNLQQQDVENQHDDLFTRFMEQINFGVYITDEKGRISFWNHKMELLTGIRAADALEKPVWEIHSRILPEKSRTAQLQSQLNKAYLALLKTGRSDALNRLGEHEILDPDGRKLVLHGTICALPVGTGHRLIAMWEDISEQKRVADVLKASEVKFRNMVEQANDAITIFDEGGTILEWNGGCERISGVHRDDALGKRLSDVLPELFRRVGSLDRSDGRSTHELALRNLEELLQSGDHRSQDTEVVNRLDGKTRWIQSVTFPIQAGPLRLFGSIARDMTATKETEERLQRHMHQLESLRQAGLEIAAELGLDSLVWMIAPRAIEMLNGAAMALYLHNPEKDILELAISLGENQPLLEKTAHRGETLAGQVWETGKSILLEDYHTGRTANLDKKYWGKVAGAPISWGPDFLGVLFVFSDQAFYETDLKILELFSAHAAAAIRNALLHQQLSMLAITDSLTGIINRRHFFELSETEFQEAVRYNRPFSVLMFDLDLFKLVNDKYGHSKGDDILRTVAQRCAATVRQTDILGRYGGEEFVAVLPQTGSRKAAALADRLRQVISSSPIATETGSLTITASFGVSTLTADVQDLMKLLNRADAALYQAKQSGRNRVCIWAEDMNAFLAENWP